MFIVEVCVDIGDDWYDMVFKGVDCGYGFGVVGIGFCCF